MLIKTQADERIINDNDSNQNVNKWRDNKRSDRKCSHYGVTCHLKESCFKIVGYPEWFKGNRDQKEGSLRNKVYANSTVTTENSEKSGNSTDNSNSNSQMSELIQKKVAKYLSHLSQNLANLVSLLE